MIEAVKDYKIVLFAEECVEWGSIGEHLAYCLQQAGWNGTFLHAAVHTANLPMQPSRRSSRSPGWMPTPLHSR